LKAGYIDNHVFHDSKLGTPQGGVISPLLANIALHGMEEALGIRRDKTGANISSRTLVRYADDFIVACKTETDAKLVVSQLADWLQIRGLSFCLEKTQIVHVSQGFNLLGFNVRLYNCGAKQKLLTKPSKPSQVKFRQSLKTTWKSLIGKPIAIVLAQINPIIRGWVN
jgi:RNA-directed DNA polymerase